MPITNAQSGTRIDEITKSGYLIGYQPSNAAWDASYRNIVVKVNRPDATVFHRHGYFRMPSPGGFDRRGQVTVDRLTAAGFEVFRSFDQDAKDFAGFSKTKLKMPTERMANGRATAPSMRMTASTAKKTPQPISSAPRTRQNHWRAAEIPWTESIRSCATA